MQSQPTPSSTEIHPSAIVSTSAQIGAGCYIGPYVTIGADVTLGCGVRVDSHCVVDGQTRIGDETHVYPFVSIGLPPQDLKFAGEETETEIGCRSRIREFVTIHRGTPGGGGVTRIGSHSLIMAYVHIAHDCSIGSHVIMANAATLAGHVTVEDYACVGALCPVHQFVRVGAHSYIGGGTTLTRDVLPFSKTSDARDARAYGMNSVGLERRGFSKDRIAKIHHAYRILLNSKLNTSQALERLKSERDPGEDVDQLIRFIENSERGVIK